MKRAARFLLVMALALGGAVLLGGPAAADVQDFTISSFSADYYLGQDSGGRSTLRTVETIAATFPATNQNRGILRYLVSTYDGHPTDLNVVSVTNQNKVPLSFDTSDDGDFVDVKIGDPTQYVHGTQVYVITYTQHNVTKFFSNKNNDEFYWDTNGTAWPQSFGKIVARVHIPSALSARLDGTESCYQGAEGSTTPCDITVQAEGSGSIVTAIVPKLGPYQNVTVAIGFEPKTFASRDNSAFSSGNYILEFILVGLAVLIGAGTVVMRATVFADAPGRNFIIAEYTPPLGVNLATSAIVSKRNRRAIAATLLDFAVRRTIKIIEGPPTGFLSTKPSYTIELQSTTGFDSQEERLASAFFAGSLEIGTQYTINKNDVSLGRKIYALMQSFKTETTTAGFTRKVSWFAKGIPPLAVILIDVFAFMNFTSATNDEVGGVVPFLTLIPAVVASLIVFAIVKRVPLTAKGSELRDYLKGLELYIKMAEADRLEFLQSPGGAESTPVATGKPGEILKLNERLLGYAVLFNQEKEWAKQLGEFYGGNPPDYYAGVSTFNAVNFASGIGGLSVASSGALSGSSSSSSSGGSGGGGSSGGGGGGGGGGGW